MLDSQNSSRFARGLFAAFSFMNSTGVGLVIAGLLMAYVLSAAVAFAVMYRVGPRFPSADGGHHLCTLRVVVASLDGFRHLYQLLCVWSYRLIVGGPLSGGWPPPPPSLGPSEDENA